LTNPKEENESQWEQSPGLPGLRSHCGKLVRMDIELTIPKQKSQPGITPTGFEIS
jgi:hypothetical protein